IKILRRPKSPVQTAKVLQMNSKSKPLAQREADYNAAREKIFGPSSSISGSGSGNSNNNSNSNNNNNDNRGANSTLATSRSNSRSSSTSRSGSSSPSPSTSQSGSRPGPGSSAQHNQRHGIKPIEFRGSPPSIKLAQRPPTGTSGGSHDGNTVIRQPQGPSMSPQTSSQTRGAKQERQEGSIGFQRPFRGAPPRPPAPSS
ncbi:hypothetical protein BGX21_011581, partial [Mortierella sp. AD011]